MLHKQQMPMLQCKFHATGAYQGCVHFQAMDLPCTSCSGLEPKCFFSATRIASGSSCKCVHWLQNQKSAHKRSLEQVWC